MRARKGEQLPAERTALIAWRDEKLVEIALWQMQRQHGGRRSAVVGDEQAPAVFDLPPHAGAELRQQEIARVLEPRRDPAFHPDTGDIVIFVDARGTDDEVQHRLSTG